MWQVLKDLRGIFTTDGKRQEGMDSVRRKQIPRAMSPRFGMTSPKQKFREVRRGADDLG